ncbi:MAG: GNAT family N-acetyltransferase [Mycobacteriales bacterium]
MLTGELVTLRAVTDDDVPALFAMASEDQTWEERSARPLAAESVEDFRARRADPQHADLAAEFVIAVDQRFIGQCTLMREDTLARHAEAGISVTADARGRGYGTDAMRTLVRYAFTRRNLRRVYLRVLESNTAALASYRKVGFVEEGRLREQCWVRGHYENEVLMGVLRDEWTG